MSMSTCNGGLPLLLAVSIAYFCALCPHTPSQTVTPEYVTSANDFTHIIVTQVTERWDRHSGSLKGMNFINYTESLAFLPNEWKHVVGNGSQRASPCASTSNNRLFCKRRAWNTRVNRFIMRSFQYETALRTVSVRPSVPCACNSRTESCNKFRCGTWCDMATALIWNIRRLFFIVLGRCMKTVLSSSVGLCDHPSLCGPLLIWRCSPIAYLKPISQLRFDCDATTTRLRRKIDVIFSRVEWKQARAIVVVVSQSV